MYFKNIVPHRYQDNMTNYHSFCGGIPYLCSWLAGNLDRMVNKLITVLFHCLTLQLYRMTEKNNTVEFSYNDIKLM
jgi:hypothetical protein